MNEEIIKFFESVYYENDILDITGVNCFNYENGQVDPLAVIEAIQEADLKISLEYEY